MLLHLLGVLGPIFVLIAAGRVLRSAGVIGDAGAADLARILYWFALPLQLVALGASVDVRAHFDVRVLAAVVAAFTATLVLGWLLTPRMDPAVRGSALSGAARANGAFVALPMVELAAAQMPPEQGAALRAAFAMLLGPSVIMFNIGSVIAFRLPHHGLTRQGMVEALAELPRNPLIIASALGLMLGAIRPGLLTGGVLGDSVQLAAGAAIPLALLLAGFGLSRDGLAGHGGTLTGVCIGKLLVAPALTWAAGWALGCDPLAVTAAVFLMGAPAAMASVPMARLLGGDAAISTASVTATTVLAAPALAGWIVVMRWWA